MPQIRPITDLSKQDFRNLPCENGAYLHHEEWIRRFGYHDP
jgi:hypothetical protein